MHTDIGAHFEVESMQWRIKSAPGMIVIVRYSLIKAPLANCYKCRASRASMSLLTCFPFVVCVV